jgi:hypothetical protein
VKAEAKAVAGDSKIISKKKGKNNLLNKPLKEGSFLNFLKTKISFIIFLLPYFIFWW